MITSNPRQTLDHLKDGGGHVGRGKLCSKMTWQGANNAGMARCHHTVVRALSMYLSLHFIPHDHRWLMEHMIMLFYFFEVLQVLGATISHLCFQKGPFNLLVLGISNYIVIDVQSVLWLSSWISLLWVFARLSGESQWRLGDSVQLLCQGTAKRPASQWGESEFTPTAHRCLRRLITFLTVSICGSLGLWLSRCFIQKMPNQSLWSLRSHETLAALSKSNTPMGVEGWIFLQSLRFYMVEMRAKGWVKGGQGSTFWEKPARNPEKYLFNNCLVMVINCLCIAH
jgi:hypothetical protein